MRAAGFMVSSSSSGTTTASDGGGACRQGLLWLAVESSTATVGAQLPTTSTAGSHDTTRHAMRPTVATCWLHWPYRNWVHPALRLLQSPLAHPQPHGASLQLQMAAYAVPGRSTKSVGATASAVPTSAVRVRKLRRFG